MERSNSGQTSSTAKNSKSGMGFFLAICFVVVGTGLTATAHSAPDRSKIFVKNETTHELVVRNVVPSGDSLSKKAWKQGVKKIAQGKNESVLVLNRSGKFNWMDPTPRFIEPGKTVIFAVELTVSGATGADTLSLKQKLLGTGKSSKLWYSIEAPNQKFDWQLNDTEVQGTWNPTEDIKLKFTYGSFIEKGATHVQYVFSLADS